MHAGRKISNPEGMTGYDRWFSNARKCICDTDTTVEEVSHLDPHFHTTTCSSGDWHLPAFHVHPVNFVSWVSSNPAHVEVIPLTQFDKHFVASRILSQFSFLLSSWVWPGSSDLRLRKTKMTKTILGYFRYWLYWLKKHSYAVSMEIAQKCLLISNCFHCEPLSAAQEPVANAQPFRSC